MQKIMSRSTQDLSGKVFGHLTVLKKDHIGPDRRWYYLCQCDCGKKSVVRSNALTTGNSKFIATHHHGTGATEETTEYTLERLCVIHNTEDWRHECFSVRGLPCYELKWLHQLQHLMIGCGIEKEITL